MFRLLRWVGDKGLLKAAGRAEGAVSVLLRCNMDRMIRIGSGECKRFLLQCSILEGLA
jgi:hypothetical protein